MNIEDVRAKLIAQQAIICATLEVCDINGLRAQVASDNPNAAENVKTVERAIDYNANLLEASNHISMALDALARAGGAA